ncbi:RHS repeat-associated core domain-containing protein [Pseudomonas capeferrum]|uniref:RHS repeat-associated core domain-containing protein n=1 Tax=Pseudomonas capeferrum TaxID=1495066 RepID=UPI0015E43858|nr:RHS repeat-associated core domain-containing protein [Pseudomonas capeferrum]
MANVYLLQTDRQQSVLGGDPFPGRAYTAYGGSPRTQGPMQAFAGEVCDPFTGCYPLGNGLRFYNPRLLRFHSADRLSPFGKGGLNAYAYCLGDPVNFSDPTGRFPSWIFPVRSIVAGLINLGISAVKGYRNYKLERDFTLSAGNAASRAGEVTFGTPENAVSRWSAKDKAVALVGTVSAAMSIGTATGRLVGADSNILGWVDTAFATVATGMSAYELYSLGAEPVPRRYPVSLDNARFRSGLSRSGSIRETSV